MRYDVCFCLGPSENSTNANLFLLDVIEGRVHHEDVNVIVRVEYPIDWPSVVLHK